MPNVDPSFVKTGKIVKDVWRVCREAAERETERLSSLRTGKIVKEVCRVCRETTGLESNFSCTRTDSPPLDATLWRSPPSEFVK